MLYIYRKPSNIGWVDGWLNRFQPGRRNAWVDRMCHLRLGEQATRVASLICCSLGKMDSWCFMVDWTGVYDIHIYIYIYYIYFHIYIYKYLFIHIHVDSRCLNIWFMMFPKSQNLRPFFQRHPFEISMHVRPVSDTGQEFFSFREF